MRTVAPEVAVTGAVAVGPSARPPLRGRPGHPYLLDSFSGSGLVSDAQASAETATVSTR